MPKIAKNHAHLTNDEMKIVNEIITICVAKTYHFVMTYNNPKEYADEILKFSDSKKNFALTHYVLNATRMMPDQVLYPKDENEKLGKELPYDINEVTNATLNLARETSTYLKSWEMTEVLQNLAKVDNIRGKDKIKQLAPQALPKLRKGEGYKKSKREGYYSIYKITKDLETLNKVISNPEAIHLIYNQLKHYGILEKFLLHKRSIVYVKIALNNCLIHFNLGHCFISRSCQYIIDWILAAYGNF